MGVIPGGRGCRIHPAQPQADRIAAHRLAKLLGQIFLPGVDRGGFPRLRFSMGTGQGRGMIDLIRAAEQELGACICAGPGQIDAALHIDPVAPFRLTLAKSRIRNSGAVDHSLGQVLPEPGIYGLTVRDVQFGM